MTISFMAGRRIQGLSTETPPLTFEDDFTSYANTTEGDTAYPTSDTTKIRVNPTNDNIDFDLLMNGGNKSIVKNLGSISDKFVLRGKIRFTTLNDESRIYIGLSDSNQTVGITTNQNFIGFAYTHEGTATNIDGLLSSIDSGSGNTVTEQDGGLLSINTDYYFEIIRNELLLSVRIYSDSNFSTIVKQFNNVAISNTISGLQYLKICNIDVTTSGDANSMVGVIDDIKFYNGVTSVTSGYKPTNVQSGSRFEETDTRKIYYGGTPSVTFEDDFSGTDDWTDQGTKIAVNTSTDVLDIDVVRDGSSYATVYDLGAGNVSDTSWVLRWRENYSTITTGSSSPHHYIGLSSGDQTVGGRSNQKCIVLRPYQTATGTKALYATWCDSTHQPTNSPSANATVETFTASTSTDYFYEIRRTSSTEAVLSRYTDSTYSTTASSYTFTNLSGVDGLRYIKVGNDNGGSGAGQLVGIIDDIKFYNGVTSTDFTWTEEV